MLVNDRNFSEVLALFAGVDELAVDTETTGLKFEDVICGVSLYNPKVGSAYFPICHEQGENIDPPYMAELGIVIASKRLIFFNGKFDIPMFAKSGIDLFGKWIEDPMLAAHLMNENEYARDDEGKLIPGREGVPKTDFTLDTLTTKYCGADAARTKKEMDQLLADAFPDVPKKERKGLMWKLSPEVVGPYAEGDVEMTWKLRDFYLPELKRWKIEELWRQVCRYSVIIAKMEYTGLLLDVPKIHEYMAEAETKIAPAKEEVDRLAGYPINLKSPKQVHAFLGVDCADKDALEAMKVGLDPVKAEAAKAILNFRGWEKVNSTYYRPYLKLMDKDHCLHPNLNLTGTVTGRLSAFEPNLQAVPRETETYKVKDVFVARPGYVLMEGDLSQAEIRLASHYGKELEMKRIVMAGLDMHTTVSNDLKIPRDAAKRINFSVIYGIGAKKLADNLKIPIPMATEYLTKYHTKFPGFKRLYNAADRDAQNQGYIRMFTGRLRHYDQFNPTHKASSNLVQGGVGEIMRLTILWIDENLPDVRQLLMVHDSVVMEVPEGRVDEVAESIQAYVASFPFDPPQRMDLKWGPNWGEMKKWEKKKEAMSA